MPASSTEFGSLRHLAGRFAGTLWPGGPGRGGDAWAQLWLTPFERTVWRRLPRPDRRHAVTVAREVVATVPRGALGADVVAAALLHDAGKLDAGLSVWGRTAATAAALVLGRERVGMWAATGEGPSGRAGQPSGNGRRDDWRARAGRYVLHDRLGADLLAGGGSGDLVVRWAREHHLPPERWSVDPTVGALLKAADGD